jgi:hypothetical protein
VTDRLLVAPCSIEAARFAVQHWHYSRTMPMPPIVAYGVWERGDFAGCVLFSRGAAKALGRPYGLGQTECVELVRVALRTHESAVSAVVARGLRELKSSSPGLRLVISFADPNVGHHGGIYQAGNWLYLGQSPDATFFRDAAGKVHHPRVVAESGYVVQFGKATPVPKRSECEPVKMAGKHRYAMPLDRAMRRQLRPLALPFPRRAVQGSTGAGSPPG